MAGGGGSLSVDGGEDGSLSIQEGKMGWLRLSKIGSWPEKKIGA